MAAAKDLSDGLTSVKPVKVNPAKGDPAAECEDGSLDIAACCAQFTLDQEKAHFAHSTALSAAYAAFEAELMNWNQACAQYKFATSTAKSALLKAAGDARTAFIAKDNADSSACRIHYFFATLQEAVAAAIQVYEAALAGAATTLAAEAGNVFAAYAAYAGAANNAAAARLVSDATAEQAFWQGIEQARDGS